MFSSARIKLTLGYCLLIILITSFFSFLLYVSVSEEINQSFRKAQIKFHVQQLGEPMPHDPLEVKRFETQYLPALEFDDFKEDLHQAHLRIIYRLTMINVVVWLISSVLAYYFAGKTLDPIEKAMTKQKQFVSDASHELRTPLTALKTSLEVDVRDKSLSTKMQALLQPYLNEVNQIVNLAEVLLTLARFDESYAKTQKKNVDVKKLVDQLEKSFQPRLTEKKIKLEKDIMVKKILSDKALLTQLLQIILDNAIKYSNPESKIKVKIAQIRNTVEIRVDDSGVGISKEDQNKIFDRFYRSDTSRHTQGFGLGLSLAENIVGVLQGSIRVKSALSKGTSVFILLPNV